MTVTGARLLRPGTYGSARVRENPAARVRPRAATARLMCENASGG
ncbi:hypothetical protein ACWF94_07915 [Streptomyces sp. NPDC055078]